MKIIKILFILTLFYSQTFAANIDHFNVKISSNTAKVGESLDLTIEALDKDNNIIPDYNGSILVFSESDPNATFPNALKENSYTFTPADQGSVKFENAVIFNKEGKQDIYVYDLNYDDSVFGFSEIDISKDITETEEEIRILNPENGLTLGENKVNISGFTKKNHQVKIILNGKLEFKTNSNNEGIFSVEISPLVDGENQIKAQILDSDNIVIGESEEIKIKVKSVTPRIKNIKITPKENIDPESTIQVEIESEPQLLEVSVIINDSLTKLKEESNGIYKGELIAPKIVKSYNVDAILRDELGNEAKEFGIETIKLRNIELNSAKTKVTLSETGELNSASIENSGSKLQITGLKLTKLKTKSVLTWNKIDGINKYSVYKKLESGELELIETVTEPRFEVEIAGDTIKYDYFAVKAFDKDELGNEIVGDLSEATKIQTGPEILILLFLSIFIGTFALIFFSRKRA